MKEKGSVSPGPGGVGSGLDETQQQQQQQGQQYSKTLYCYVHGEWAEEDEHKKKIADSSNFVDDNDDYGYNTGYSTSSSPQRTPDALSVTVTATGTDTTPPPAPPPPAATSENMADHSHLIKSPSHDDWLNAQHFNNDGTGSTDSPPRIGTNIGTTSSSGSGSNNHTTTPPRGNRTNKGSPSLRSKVSDWEQATITHNGVTSSGTKKCRQKGKLSAIYTTPATRSLYHTTQPMRVSSYAAKSNVLSAVEGATTQKPEESCLVTSISCVDNVVLTFMNKNGSSQPNTDVFLGQIDIRLSQYPRLMYGEKVVLTDVPFGAFAVPVGNAQQKRMVTSGNQVNIVADVCASISIQALTQRQSRAGWLPKKQFSMFTSSFVNYYFVVTDSKIQYFTNAHSLESPKGSILKADVKSITCCKLGTHDSVFDDVIEALAHSEQGVTAMMPTTGVEVKITTDRETWHLQLLHSDSDSGAGGGSSGDGSSSRDRMSVAESRQWMHALYAHCPQLDKQHGLTSHAEVTSTATPYKHNNAGRDGAAAAAAAGGGGRTGASSGVNRSRSAPTAASSATTAPSAQATPTTATKPTIAQKVSVDTSTSVDKPSAFADPTAGAAGAGAGAAAVASVTPVSRATSAQKATPVALSPLITVTPVPATAATNASASANANTGASSHGSSGGGGTINAMAADQNVIGTGRMRQGTSNAEEPLVHREIEY